MRLELSYAWMSVGSWAVWTLLSGFVTAAEPPGQAVFVKQCASCHGERGQGVADEYPNPLVGDRSLRELTGYIERTMPKGSAHECVGEDAAAVAAYMFEAFYSPAAQVRNAPPRIELARLTVRQHRETLADLFGSFRWTNRFGPEQGLRGEYFVSRKFWEKKDRRIERTDPVVAFDFGDSSPDPEQIPPKEFGMRWEGSVLATQTGDYEFVIRTDNAARLWVDDMDAPLVDVWVKSGSDTEFRGRLKLLGGRAYPIRIECFKSKEPKASMTLAWRPPHGVEETIPARHLSPQPFPEAFVAAAAFPPDDRSVGYERGNAVSQAWDQATTDAAFEAAAYAVRNLRDLAEVREKDSPEDRRRKIRAFAETFVERAFRRPLSDDLRERLIERQFREVESPEAALTHTIVLALKSPRFLFREVTNVNDGYDAASRLSYALWDSLPDKDLLQAAARNELQTPEQVRAQAERMVRNPRTRAKFSEFLQQWLKVDHFADVSKDSETFPDFNAVLVADLRTSLELFLDDIIWSEASDFRQLLQSDDVFLNGRLGRFYGLEIPLDAPFQKVMFEPESRAGLLSHPYLLAGFAYTSTSSPIHRGVFISRSLLGRALRPPPEAVAPLAANLHADLTTRERVLLQTRPEACQSCHDLINPLGFTLEHFDAVGRFRTEEQGKPIDATGTYVTRTGEAVTFRGVGELARFLVDSPETHAAFVEQVFHHQWKQPIRAYSLELLPSLTQRFAEQGFKIRQLLVDTAVAGTLVSRPADAAAVSQSNTSGGPSLAAGN